MARKTLPKEERETIISRTGDEDGWNVYSCDPVMLRRLNKLLAKFPDRVSVRQIDRDGFEFTVPRKWVRLSGRASSGASADTLRAMSEKARAVRDVCEKPGVE